MRLVLPRDRLNSVAVRLAAVHLDFQIRIRHDPSIEEHQVAEMFAVDREVVGLVEGEAGYSQEACIAAASAFGAVAARNCVGSEKMRFALGEAMLVMDRSRDYRCLEVVFVSALKCRDLPLVAAASDSKIHSVEEEMLDGQIGGVRMVVVVRLELDTDQLSSWQDTLLREMSSYRREIGFEAPWERKGMLMGPWTFVP
jgi:hypothetical protein